MATKDRVRGMNAAFSTGEAGVGEMRPAKAPIRPRQLLVALAVAAGGATAALMTYQAMAEQPPSFTGQVTPSHAYYLNFGNAGTLKTLAVRPGELVRSGQVLATEDSTVDESNLQAAKAEVQADAALLAADENPGVDAAQQGRLQLAVAKAQAAVDSAQSALTVAQNAAKSSGAVQNATVAGRQQVLNADTARYTQSCSTPPGPSTPPPAAGPGPSTPAPKRTGPPTTPPPSPTRSSRPPATAGPSFDVTLCQNLQMQITRDSAALSEAQVQLTSAQSAASDQQQRDADQLAQSQTLLQSTQSQAGLSTTPVTPAAVPQAKSLLAAAQAKVAADQQALNETTIVAPVDGTVADTAAAVGDQVHPEGIRLYNGPAEQSGTVTSQQQGFQLFAPPATSGGGGGNQQAGYVPLLTLYSGPMTVTAQLPEASIGGIHSGQSVTLNVTAAHVTVQGTVSKILIDPARVPGAVYYDVLISMAGAPPEVLPGMTVNVAPKS